MSTTPFDPGAARILAIEAMNVPAAGHTADRAALITTLLDACAEVERLQARVAEQDTILEEHKHAAWERSERD